MRPRKASTASVAMALQPSRSVPGGFYRGLIGDPDAAGRFRYQIKLPAGHASQHTGIPSIHVKVLSGSKAIVIGEPLTPARARHFAAGELLLTPAHSWHQEWWNEETVEQIEGFGPMETEYRTKQ